MYVRYWYLPRLNRIGILLNNANTKTGTSLSEFIENKHTYVSRIMSRPMKIDIIPVSLGKAC